MPINMSNLVLSGKSLLSAGGSTPPVPEGIALSFSEFNQGALSGGEAIQDPTGTFNPPVGFTINNTSNSGSGVQMSNLLPATISALDASVYSSGYIWTMYWAAGSTYASTRVTMNYPTGSGVLTFWILNPGDDSQPVPNGTFNYPATLVEGTDPAIYPF